MKENFIISEFMSDNLKKKDYNYHNSWDLLIPVLNKCRERILKIIDNEKIDREIMEMDLTINNCMNDKFIIIENIYNEVVKFIEWQKKYNVY